MHYKHHKRMMADVQEELRSLDTGEPLQKVWSDPHNSRVAAHMGLTEPKGKLIGHYKIGQHKVHVFDDNEGNHDFVIYHPNQKDRIIGKVSTMENIERDKDGNEIGGQSTSHSYVDDYHRGKGIGRALYQAALHHHGELYSSVALSPHSDKMWRNFKKLKGAKFKAGRINTDKQHYATIAPEVQVPLMKGLKGDWQKEGYTLEHSVSHDERFTPHWRNHIVVAKDKNGKVAGKYGFSEKITDEKFNVPDFYPAHSKTGEKHRRKGLASAAYALVEQKTGKKLKYSFSQTRAAEKLWAQPNKPFGMTDEEIEQDQQKTKLQKSQQDIPEVATVAIVYKNQMLMGKRKDNGKYTNPGGHLDAGEKPHDGAIRELQEESGIKADKLESLGSETIKCEDGKTRTIHVFALLGTKPEYVSLKNDPDGEFSKLFWVDVSKGLPDEIKNNLHSPKNVLLKKIGLQ